MTVRTFSACVIRHLLVIAALTSISGTSALAEYRLEPGDVLDLALVGSPDFHQRMPIEIDGTVTVPLVGQMKVADLTVAETRTLLTRALSNKIYEPPAPPGSRRLILPSEIAVTVAEYRPVYVSGYVAKPGGYPFRPGMTVRQAIALAGGFGPVQDPRVDAAAQIYDLRAQREALTFEYAAAQDRISRLRKELGLTPLQTPAGRAVSLPGPTLNQIKENNSQLLQALSLDRQNDKQSYRTAVQRADMQIKALLEKKQKDEEGVKADNQELDAVRSLFSRGITANARLSEARRAALLSSDQLLQTVVEISNVERQKGDYLRQIDKIESQAKIDDWRDLQQAGLQFVQTATRLKSTEDRLAGLGAHQISGGQSMQLSVMRYSDGHANELKADDDLQLAPGDVVTVRMEPQNALSTGVAAEPSTSDSDVLSRTSGEQK